MQPSARVYCNRISLVLDILPLLSIIILPPFRPVSLHLYTKDEKESMLKVVNVMIDYNLNYVQERTQDGVYVYNLEPNIEELVVFDNQNKRRALSYSNKQLISREIELEKLRRCETAKAGDPAKPKMTDRSEKREKQTKDGENQLPNHLQKLQVKKVDVSKTVSVFLLIFVLYSL
ncbi:unnamed protein product [Acanthoscelides obtectus]|uniref:Uncharacterized protein n=1 Tax=Acanthoscelides obtectus TaxID=200917 RepID=A0A9P0KNZ4_ACAOB|nr:unnamed protein product [Acanthoscelides obtectus]CAK1638212.1 Chromosome transmission fidelity protein 18 homolog [Acanthoscelides obtectus]